MQIRIIIACLFFVLLGCKQTSEDKNTSDKTNDTGDQQKTTVFEITFTEGLVTQNYDPDVYDLDRNIHGNFCFHSNYPEGTKAIVSTYHYVESANDAPEFQPKSDTVELEKRLCIEVSGPHAFGNIGFRIPKEIQSKEIQSILENEEREVFFSVANKSIASDTVSIELELLK